MLLATSRICARPITFYNNFGEYNDDIVEDDIV